MALAVAALAAYAATSSDSATSSTAAKGKPMKFEITKTEEEWKMELTPDQYHYRRAL
jgi:hypothetical protein